MYVEHAIFPHPLRLPTSLVKTCLGEVLNDEDEKVSNKDNLL